MGDNGQRPLVLEGNCTPLDAISGTPSKEEAQREALRLWNLNGRRGVPFIFAVMWRTEGPRWIGAVQEVGPGRPMEPTEL